MGGLTTHPQRQVGNTCKGFKCMKNLILLTLFSVASIFTYGQTYRKLQLSEVNSIELWILSFGKYSKAPIPAKDILEFHDSHSEFYSKDVSRLRKIIKHYNHLKTISNENDYVNARVLCRIKLRNDETIDMIINQHQTIKINGQSYKFDKKLCNFLLDELNPLTPTGGWD